MEFIPRHSGLLIHKLVEHKGLFLPPALEFCLLRNKNINFLKDDEFEYCLVVTYILLRKRSYTAVKCHFFSFTIEEFHCFKLAS